MKSFDNFSASAFAAHRNYIGEIDLVSCRYVNEVHPSEMCEFSIETQSCHELEGRVDYAHMLFCDLAREGITKSVWRAEILSIGISIVFGIFIAVLSFQFLLPNMLAIIKFLKLNEHTAGFCIVAAANALPEILGVFFRFEGDTEMLVNELMGTTMYLKAFHVGCLVLFYPLAVFPPFLIRDNIFYLIGLFIFYLLLLNVKTHVYEAVACVLCCIAYILCMFVQQKVLLKSYSGQKSARDDLERQEVLKWGNVWKFLKPVDIKTFQETQAANGADWVYSKAHLIASLNPIRREMYKASNFFLKALLIVGSPFSIVMNIFIPVVNQKLPMNGWCKPLNCLNLLLMPLLLELGLTLNLRNLAYFLTPGAILCVISIFTTKSDSPPKFHILFALYGFLGCTLLSYVLASEMVAIWYLIGSMEGLGRSTIGITFLSWGNTIQELVINYALASWGFPLMAFVAFYSVPILNMFFALALTILIQAISSKTLVVNVRQGSAGETSMILSIVHHVVTSIAICCSNFQFRRSFGVFSIIFYVIYLLFVILAEKEIIHAYGTDHSHDAGVSEASWA